MKKTIGIIPALAFAALAFAYNVDDNEYPEVHCKHFFYGYPTGTPVTNDLIIREIYALSSNDDTKFADWVAYRLDPKTVTGQPVNNRTWKTEPWLEDRETLEPNDYDGFRERIDLVHGYQAPLATFRGTGLYKDTNYLSNITPQMEPLNGGPWMALEGRVRKLVIERRGEVYVMTGPLYDGATAIEPLRRCVEAHTVPTGYWKIVAVQEGDEYDTIRTASFIFGQNTQAGVDPLNYLVTIEDVENRSGLEFLEELPDSEQTRIKTNSFQAWAAENLD